MKLLIISHTEHYLTTDGTVVGLGSTVTEINHLLGLFDEIVHLAMLHKGPAPASTLPYFSDHIHFVPLPTVGGKSFFKKLNILRYTPKVLSLVYRHLKGTDFFQFRAPTGIGVFVIPYLVLFTKKKGWFKYAGNWNQENAPLAYRFQKWLLENQSRHVTINGFWDNQPLHCLSFENPCLTDKELDEGKFSTLQKDFDSNALEFCFVGRLEEAKGLGLLIAAFGALSKESKKRIHKIHLVGDGEARNYYEDLTKKSGLPFVFYGLLSRSEVHKIYKKSHALLLPSVSEGFPKVLSEAMNYGCIPLVSNVSSIGHYIEDGVNGFLFESLTSDALVSIMEEFMELTLDRYKVIQVHARRSIHTFSYSHYAKRIDIEIIKMHI